MSLYSRLKNVFRRDRLNNDLDEELRLHLEDAIASGRDPHEARRALGIPVHHREASRDIKVSQWLENLTSDLVFSLRQIRKNKVTSAAAIISLALAIGTTTASFHLIDALLLRPLPVANPDRLFVISTSYVNNEGKKDFALNSSYPQFRIMRAAVRDEAELLSIEPSRRRDLTYGADADMEKAHVQRISGWTFQYFGLEPALGRLLTENDDLKPGAHPVAVISYDYWQNRFGGNPNALGTTFRQGTDRYQIVGVAPKGFTGTETGTPTSIFMTSMMNAEAIDQMGWTWFRPWVVLKPGANPEVVRQKLAAAIRAIRVDRVKNFPFPPGSPKSRIEIFLQPEVQLVPASAGVSMTQRTYKQALLILGILVVLLLGIACANVANLMMAQAYARAREMALRVSIGAGRLRLIQLVITESLIIAAVASTLGFAFSLWAAPEVLSRINPSDDPIRLGLNPDLRVFFFLVSLTALVTILFGLAPALRASSIRPSAALKGGEDPHARRRLMHALIAAQIAFCFVVHFTAGLFFSSYDRLVQQPTGFDSNRLLTLSVVANPPLNQSNWNQASEQLRGVPGVESFALASYPLLTHTSTTNHISVGGANPPAVPPFFLFVSPSWFETMKIPLLEGRDFRPADTKANVAIVNQSFAVKFFAGASPIGKSFVKLDGDRPTRLEIIGLAKDARLQELAEEIHATVYTPFPETGSMDAPKPRPSATIMVRTTAQDPRSLAGVLRKEVNRSNPSLRVSNLVTQSSIVDGHTIRERLLALLGGVFAIVALILFAVGLYGVLSFSVQQRRRELGIRLALGAQPMRLAWHVSLEIFMMLLLGSASGLVLGLASERYLKDLLFGVKATDWQMLIVPLATILGAAMLAAVLPILRAIRINPGTMLRSE